MIGMRSKSAYAATAAVVTSGSLFATYKIIFLFSSPEALGCWVLIQAGVIAARLTESGLSTTLIRYVSAARQAKVKPSLQAILGAGAVMGPLPVALIGIVSYVPIVWLLKNKYPEQTVDINIENAVLLALICGGLQSITGVFQAIIEGLGHIKKNSVLNSFSAVITPFFCYALIPGQGIEGIGKAFCLSYLVQLCMSATVLHWVREIGNEKICISQRPNIREILKTTWRENLSTSSAGLIRLSFEPLTKIMMATCASLSSIAVFEIALKITNQMRAVIQSAFQPLLSIDRVDTSSSDQVFRDFQNASAVMAPHLLAISLVLSPILSVFFMSQIDTVFIIYFAILTIGATVNTIGYTGYYFSMSSGGHRRIARITFNMLLVNCFGAIVAASLSSPVLMATSYALIFVYGGFSSMKIWTNYQKTNILSTVQDTFKVTELFSLIVAAVYMLLVLTYSKYEWLKLNTIIIASIAAATLCVLAAFNAANQLVPRLDATKRSD